MMDRRRAPLLAFGAVMMASSCMNNLFVTFYLNLFVHVARLSPNVFYLGQTMYAAWNSVNDPLFGFCQDAGASSRQEAFRRRILAIKWGGLAWTVAFVGVWFPPQAAANGMALEDAASSWGSSLVPMVHFVLSVCLYDAFLTLVEVSHSAVLSEITTSEVERASFNAYAAAMAAFGSLSSVFGQYAWHDRGPHALDAFRGLVIALALACAGVFVWSASVLERRASGSSTPSALEPEGKSQTPTQSALAFALNLRHHRNFWVFVSVGCLQAFDCAFEKCSFAIVLDRSTEEWFSPAQRGLIISASFFLPWLLVLLATPRIQSQGVYTVLSLVFTARVGICIAGFLSTGVAASSAPFLLVNRVCSEFVCRVSPLVLADIIDEDRYLNSRQGESRAASIVGAHHFFTKLFSSIGPMVAFTLITSNVSSLTLRILLIAVPFSCVATQLLLWRFAFSLKTAYLKVVKTFVDDESGLGL